MKNYRITLKLFVTTTIFFIFFISALLIFQTLFFQKFYLKEKTNNFLKSSQRLVDDVKKAGMAEEDIYTLVSAFDEKNNSSTVIINIPKFNEYVEGKKFYEANTDLFLPRNYSKSKIAITPALKEWRANPDLYNSVVTNMKSLIYRSKYENGSISSVSPIITEGRLEYVIFSITSLQPVGEAVTVLNKFYVFVYISAILLIILLSILFSIMISKPLINLKKMAMKMAALDFTSRCDVKSKDEIGDLARIFNLLSDKLGRTLFELKTANDKLKADIEKERQLETMRKEFVAGVSHELKTPISLIGGYAEALKDDIVRPQDRKDFLEVILDESRKMDFLVKDMLDLSQLEAGNFKLDMGNFDLVELSERVLRKFSQNIQDKNIVVEKQIPQESLVVYGDAFRIEQVLVNFISNAIRHVPNEGKIGIHIRNKNDKALFEIENQGEPIPEDELDKIWEKFYKIDKSRTRAAEGTGIGLAIVKNILQQHGSRYGVENTSEGVKFFFELDLY